MRVCLTIPTIGYYNLTRLQYYIVIYFYDFSVFVRPLVIVHLVLKLIYNKSNTSNCTTTDATGALTNVLF